MVRDQEEPDLHLIGKFHPGHGGFVIPAAVVRDQEEPDLHLIGKFHPGHGGFVIYRKRDSLFFC